MYRITGHRKSTTLSENQLFHKAIYQSGAVIRNMKGFFCDIGTPKTNSKRAAMALCGVTEAQWDNQDFDTLKTCLTHLMAETIIEYCFPPVRLHYHLHHHIFIIFVVTFFIIVIVVVVSRTNFISLRSACAIHILGGSSIPFWEPEVSTVDDLLPQPIEEMAQNRRNIPILMGMMKDEAGFGIA